MTLHVVDLFCGAGGFSEGARKAGATVVLAVDSSEQALTVHRINHPDTSHLLMELGGDMTVAYAAISSKIPPNATLLVHASPPCSNFCTANTKRCVEAGSALLEWTVVFLKTYFSKCIFSIENVNTSRVRSILDNHNILYTVVDCSKHGINQTRKRVIGSNCNIYLPQELRQETLFDIFGPGLCKIGLRRKLQWHWKPVDLFYTVTSGKSNFILCFDNGKCRRPTTSEWARLQTFPPHYDWGNTSARTTCVHIANAVPVKLAFSLCKSYMRSLEQERHGLVDIPDVVI